MSSVAMGCPKDSVAFSVFFRNRILPQQEESDQAIDEERGSREGGYLCPWELDGIRRSVTC